MKRESNNEQWENAKEKPEMIVVDPGGLFRYGETRQCADGTIIISGSYSEADEVCPYCGSGNFTAHGNKQKKRYADIYTTPVNGNPARLRIERDRRWCNDCHRTYTPAIPGVVSGHRATTLLQDLIY